jgi:hypothetical protein
MKIGRENHTFTSLILLVIERRSKKSIINSITINLNSEFSMNTPSVLLIFDKYELYWVKRVVIMHLRTPLEGVIVRLFNNYLGDAI